MYDPAAAAEARALARLRADRRARGLDPLTGEPAASAPAPSPSPVSRSRYAREFACEDGTCGECPRLECRPIRRGRGRRPIAMDGGWATLI